LGVSGRLARANGAVLRGARLGSLLRQHLVDQ
jgi:hypothetical protein